MFLVVFGVMIVMAAAALALVKMQRSRGEENDGAWRRREIWEDYPAPNYTAWHTYCSVAFDESGRTYYYRTRNPELKPGDMVYVPVGPNHEKKAGWIVEMKNYRGRSVPYPLEKTRHILDKVRQRHAC